MPAGLSITGLQELCQQIIEQVWRVTINSGAVHECSVDNRTGRRHTV